MLFTLSLASAAQAEPHHCHDQAINAVGTNQGEKDVEALYALHVRLCCQVDAGIISAIKATEQFEAERERVIQERREYNWHQESGSVQTG